VASGGSSGGTAMRDYLSRVPRPAALLAYFNIDAPVLTSAYPDQPSLCEVLDELAAFAREQVPRALETPLLDETVELRGQPVHNLVCDLLVVGLTEAGHGARAAAEALDRVDLSAIRTAPELARRGGAQWRQRLLAG
jgi:hypothetical protein